MKKLFYFVVIVMMIICGCTAQQSKETAFYVSLSGNDDNPGTKEKPFATFIRARDAIRELKKGGPLPEGGMTVNIRGGIYSITKTFTLTEEDSGTDDTPIIWQAYPGEEVRCIGGKVITGFEPVTDLDVLNRFDKACRANILETNLKAQGINNYGILRKTGKGRPSQPPHLEPTTLELFFDGKPMNVARYPNEGWLTITDVPQTGEVIYNKDEPGQHYGRISYNSDQPKRWKELDNICIHGYWVWDWADQYRNAKKIDTKNQEIYMEEPHHHYGYRKGQRFYFYNILEELDSPGEWYLNHTNGILYFWPPSSIDESKAFVSILEDIMVLLKNTSYITFQGITFEYTRGSVVKIEGGTNNKIAGCTIRNIGNQGIIISEGTHNGVASCDIYLTGDGGISISGGDRKSLTPGGNYATNNHIHRYSRINHTYRPAILLSGVGNHISHNYIHDAPHLGVWFQGNEHILEFNEVHTIAQETGDVGAFNSAYDWTFRGNIIRYNYFHNIHGPGLYGCMTIYLDLPVGGTKIYGNILYDLDWGFFTNSGRDTTIENNIFVKCNPSVAFNVWRQPHMFIEGGDDFWRIYERLIEMNYTEPPYSTRYPKLLNIFKDGDPAIPRGNVIRRNISYGGSFFQFTDPELDFSILSITDNLIADPIILEIREKGKSVATKYKYGDANYMAEFEKYGNIVIDTDPGFVDLENENFQLKDDSPAWNLGFERIPIEKIGLYVDEYRNSLPDK